MHSILAGCQIWQPVKLHLKTSVFVENWYNYQIMEVCMEIHQQVVMYFHI